MWEEEEECRAWLGNFGEVIPASPPSPSSALRNGRGKRDVRHAHGEGVGLAAPSSPTAPARGGREEPAGWQRPVGSSRPHPWPRAAPPRNHSRHSRESYRCFIVLTLRPGSSDLSRHQPVPTRTHSPAPGPSVWAGDAGPGLVRARRSPLPPAPGPRSPPAGAGAPPPARAPGRRRGLRWPGGPGRARRARGRTRPQRRAGGPAARSHQEAVGALPRPLGAVGGLGALDLDVDRGGARFAGGGGGAGRQGHVLWAAAGRGRVLAAQGAADGLRRVPQQVGDAGAAPAGLAPRRLGVLSVETTGGRVSGLLRARRGHGLAGAGGAGSVSAPRLPPPAPRLSFGFHLHSSASSWPATRRGPRGHRPHAADRACPHVSDGPRRALSVPV